MLTEIARQLRVEVTLYGLNEMRVTPGGRGVTHDKVSGLTVFALIPLNRVENLV